jgi:hypothetical protein
MKEYWLIIRRMGLLKGTAVWLADRKRRFWELTRRRQPIRWLLSTSDHRRRHRVLEMLSAHQDSVDGIGNPDWMNGLSSIEVADRLKMYDGEAHMQLTTLEIDGMVETPTNPTTHMRHFVLNKRGVAAIRTGKYLREGVSEALGYLSLLLSITALIISLMQNGRIDDVAARVDEIIGPIREERNARSVILVDEQNSLPEPTSQLPIGPDTLATVLCGPCDTMSDTENGDAEKHRNRHQKPKE